MAERNLPKGITLRKDGLYMWRFQYDGVAYSGYCKKLSDAKKELRDRKYEVEHGIYSKEQAILFDAWFNEWLNVYKVADCKESTIDLYRSTYKRYIKPKFGNKQLRNMRSDAIQKFINEMAKGYSKTVAASVNFLLYDSLRQAARNGLISKNPMENTTPPKFKEQKKKRALSEDAERSFLEAAKGSSYYPMFRLASLTGMRIGEVLGLQWSDVNFEKGEIHITHTWSYISGKGVYLDSPKSEASRRIIPMEKGSALYELLKDQRKKQMENKMLAGQLWSPPEGLENLVFTTDHGTPYYDVNIRTEQRKIVAKLQQEGVEIEDCTFHTLRHCFATRCIENGMSLKTLQAILGHSTFTMTADLYCDVMESTKREEMQRVANIL